MREIKKYRLKRDALPFFDPKYSKEIDDIHYWIQSGVHMNALEEVEEPYISYGIENDSRLHTSGWSRTGDDKGGRFHFTINFPFMDNNQYNEAIKDSVPYLMREIQELINKRYRV